MSVFTLTAALVATALAQGQGVNRASLTSDNSGNLAVQVGPQGAFTVQTGPNGNASEVMTTDAFEYFYAPQIGTQTNQAIFNAMSEVRTNFSTLSAQVSSGLAAATSSATAGLTSLTSRVAALESAVNSLSAVIDTTISCPAYPTLQNGAVSGSGTHPGALRVLHCNTGYYLTNVSTVVCLASGQWSDATATRCSTLTPPPTTAPTFASEQVTCCALCDNEIFGVWADGNRQVLQGPTTVPIPQWFHPKQWTFPSTSRTLALHLADNECGCLCGYFVIQCGTPSGNGPWNFVTPSYDAARSMGSSFTRMWNMLTVQGQAPNVPDNWHLGNFTNLTGWTQPLGGGTHANPAIQRFGPMGAANVRDMHNRWPMPRSCPPILNGSTLATNTMSTASGMCGGLYPRNPRQQTHWFLRITPFA